MGRTDANAHLLSHAQIPASKIAFVSAKNSFTSRSIPCSYVAVAVALCDELREEGPVSGRELGVRSVCPVLRDHLLLVRQRCAERKQLLGLRDVLSRGIPRGAGRGAQHSAGCQRERRHVLPLRAGESGRYDRARVAVPERLHAFGSWTVAGSNTPETKSIGAFGET